MIKYLLIVFLSFGMMGCATIATQEKLINGKLVITERLTIEGIKSDKEAKFSDKSEIKDKSGLSDMLPDIEVDLDKLN